MAIPYIDRLVSHFNTHGRTRIDVWSHSAYRPIIRYEYRFKYANTSFTSWATYTLDSFIPNPPGQGHNNDQAIKTFYNILANRTATFEIRISNSDGTSDSRSVTFSTGSAAVPAPPEGFNVQTTDTTAVASWDVPINNGGSPILDYKILYTGLSTPVTVSASTRSHTFEGLIRGREYTFEIQSRSSIGLSDTVSRTAIIPGMPTAPTNLKGTAYTTSVLLFWQNPVDTPLTDVEFRYQEGSTPGGTWQSIGSVVERHEVGGLDPNKQYTFQVRGVNDEGGGTGSNSVTVRTADVPWEEFWKFSDLSDVAANRYKSLWLTHDRVFLTRDANRSNFNLEAFNYQGDAQSSENLPHGIYASGRLEAVTPFGKNRIISVYSNANKGVGGRVLIVRDFAGGHGRYGVYEPHDGSNANLLKDIKSVVVTQAGVLISDGGDSGELTNVATQAGIYLIPYDDLLNSLVSDTSIDRLGYTTASFQNDNLEETITRYDLLSAWGDRIYVCKEFQIYTYDLERSIVEIENIPLFRFLNNEERRDMTVYGDHLYLLTTHRIMRVDLRRARPPRPKQTIYPQFVREGGTLDLKAFVEGANSIEFDTDFDPPTHLSIDSNFQLDAGSVTEDTTLLLKFKSSNRVGETPFEFYLTIFADLTPKWKDIATIPMSTRDTLNVFRLVDNAKSIVWRSSFTAPSEVDLDNGKISFNAVPAASRIEIQLTATNPHGDSHITFYIDVIKTSRQVSYSEMTRYRLEIEGIDVTDDLVVGEDEEGNARDSIFEVTENLDVVQVNTRTVGDCELSLDNSDGQYNTYTPNNFWETNNLNPGGFLAKINLYIDSFVDGSYIEDVLFSGIIIQTDENISDVTIVLTCVDLSHILRNASLGTMGLPKQAHLFQQDEQSYEGVYTPERSLLPILAGSGSAIAGDTELKIKSVINQSEGIATTDNSAFISESDLRTSGGYIAERPLLRHRTQHRQRKARFVIDTLAEAAKLYNASVNVELPELDNRFITSHGSIAFNVERSRVTRIPVDWVHDPNTNRRYILLSNREAHVSDMLVCYDIDDDQYRVLHEFETGIFVHRLASSDFDTFYFEVTEGGSFDSSAVPRPTMTETFVANYDSTQTNKTKILRYVVSTDTTTDGFVSATDARSPQAALHYFTGFANKHLLHEFEAIVTDNRSPFQIFADNLHYRYATDSAFGVARVDTSGRTTALFSETPDDFYNSENFAFNIAGNGDVYFAFVSGGAYNQNTTLTIKRRALDGTTTTILTDSKALHELDVLDEAGGAYAGVHEVLYDNNNLYLVVQIQKVRYEDINTASNNNRYRQLTESAGAVLYRANVTGTPTLTVIEKYNFTQFACRSMTAFDGDVYFLENPTEAYLFKPINSNLDSFNVGLGYNVLPENTGSLKKTNSINDIVDTIGNLWYENLPSYGVLTPCLTFNNSLQMIVSYSRMDELLRPNSIASQPDNAQWLVYGRKLDYVLPDIPSNGTIFEVLSGIALQTGTQFSVHQNLIQFKESEPYHAQVNGIIGSTIPFDSENRDFPSEGYLLINREIVRYSGVSGGTFTGLTHGVLGSEIANHADDSKIVYLDNIINADSLNNPYQDIRIRLDTNRFYNVVRDTDGIANPRNAASIEKFGERTYELALGLTRHETAWIGFRAERYLDDLSELRYLVNVRLKPSRYILIGDIISFYYANHLLVPIRVVSITYTADSTEITGRSV